MQQPGAGDIGKDVVELFENAVDLTLRFLADREGLSISAASVLNQVGRGDPMRLTALAASEGVAQPSMTQLVQRLERQGLVRRCSDPSDGRATLVAITPAGQEVMTYRRQVRENRLTKLLETLSDEQQRVLWLSATASGPAIRQLVRNAEQSLAAGRAGADREVCG